MFSSRMMAQTAIKFDHVGLSGECSAGSAGMPCSQRSIWCSSAPLRTRPGGAAFGNKTSDSTAQAHIAGIVKAPCTPERSTWRLSTWLDCSHTIVALEASSQTPSHGPSSRIHNPAYTYMRMACRAPCTALADACHTADLTPSCIGSHPARHPAAHQKQLIA